MEQEQQKRYRAWAEIDLNALTHNVQTVQNRLPAQTQFMAVVKANAYGHGDAAICQKLWELGVRWFAVSNLEEALSVRQLCPYGEIFILGYTPPEYAANMIFLDITQEVHSLAYAQELNEALAGTNYILNVHLKLDTGMTRIGFFAYDNDRTLDELKQAAALPPFSISAMRSASSTRLRKYTFSVSPERSMTM